MRSWILAILLATSALLASACVTEEDRENIQALADELSAYEQVDEATGGVRSNGTAGKEFTLDVVLQGDASTDEVAEIAGAIDGLVDDHPIDGRLTLLVGSEAAVRDGKPTLHLVIDDRDDADVDALALLFVQALEQGLPDLADTTISDNGQVTARPVADGLDGVTAFVHAVAENPALSAWSEWLIQTEGVTVWAGSLDKATAGRWDAFVAPFEGRDDVRFESGSLNLHAGKGRIEIYLRMVPATDPATLTFADEDDSLWPVLRAELDLLQDLGGNATLQVSHSLVDAPQDADRAAYDLLDITLGQPIPDDPYERGWDRAAADHLDGP